VSGGVARGTALQHSVARNFSDDGAGSCHGGNLRRDFLHSVATHARVRCPYGSRSSALRSYAHRLWRRAAYGWHWCRDWVACRIRHYSAALRLAISREFARSPDVCRHHAALIRRGADRDVYSRTSDREDRANGGAEIRMTFRPVISKESKNSIWDMSIHL